MSHRPNNLLDRLAFRRVRRFWKRAGTLAETADLETVRDLRTSARDLKRDVNSVLNIVDGRLALPLLGSNAMNHPAGSDWVWRPALWRGPVEPAGVAGVRPRTQFGHDAAIHHDCPMNEITFRQRRNILAGDLAPFGVALDVLGFSGSYLSLLINLAPEAGQDLTRQHTLRVETVAKPDRAMNVYVRLNIKNGPNTEQLTTTLEWGSRFSAAEFDLGFSKLNEKRIEELWIDFLFESPAMNRITIRDLTISRRLRAEL